MFKIVKKLLPPQEVFKLQQKKYIHKNKAEYELIKSNDRFHDIHKGERCFVIGNGPSLSKVKFADLADEYTFTVNEISRRKDFADLKTNFHLWSDERFFDLREDRPEDMEILDVMRAVKTENNSPLVFYKAAAHSMIKNYELDKYLDIAYFSDFVRSYTTPKYTLDFTSILPNFPTVIQYAIVLAVYMGFSEIYLLGCDCTDILNTILSIMKSEEQMAYAYEISENEKKRMQRSSTVFPIQGELRSFAKLFDDYNLLDEYCKLRGVSLVNLTEGSLLKSVKQDSLDNILSK